MNDKKVIIFDFDGTLIDSAPDLSASINHMLGQLGRKEFSEETIREWIGNGAQTLVKRALLGKRNIDEQIDPEFFEKALDIFLSHYKAHLSERTYPYPYVREVLHILKNRGFKTAIVTNKPYDFIDPILKQLGIREYFDLWVGADSCKNKKPHPEPLLKVCDEFGVSVDEYVMVGDSKNDILAAKACEMESIAVTYGYNYGEAVEDFDPDGVIGDMRELVGILGIQPRVGVIGGGIAGSSVAQYLRDIGAQVELFEKKASLIDGPPMCHLHAGGNLYREISDEQCLTLLRESIELVRFYPHGIDFRPTVIAIPKEDEGSMEALLPRLEKLKNKYQKFIDEDPKNEVLGKAEEYYKLYSKEELEELAKKELPKEPRTFDEWVIPFAKYVDFSAIKFPVMIVSEFGLNLFRIAASATLMLENNKNVTLHLGAKVVGIQEDENGFNVMFEKEGVRYTKRFDYLVNAAGFASGKIDDMLGYKRERFVEFKAAYVTKWEENTAKWPEVIFHGKRGTPRGMAQFTPYPAQHFQLHGMTKDITLFEDGLVKSSPLSSQPPLDKKYITKIYTGWSKEKIGTRTRRAIEHLSRFIPAFEKAKVAAKPLYGAQQIPGNDDTLRAADFSFEGKHYARCEIVKASSIYTMADAIVKQLSTLGYFNEKVYKKRFDYTLEAEKVEELAKRFAKERGYPEEMAGITKKR